MVQQQAKDNFKWILGVELYNLYPEIFPTFSFLKGKLLTITNENISKDLKRKVRNNAIRKICIKKPYLVIFYDNNFGLIFKLKNNAKERIKEK